MQKACLEIRDRELDVSSPARAFALHPCIARTHAVRTSLAVAHTESYSSALSRVVAYPRVLSSAAELFLHFPTVCTTQRLQCP